MNDSSSTSRLRARPARLLIAVDLSVASRQVVDFASRLAPAGASIRLVSVAENPRTLIPIGSLPRAVLDSVRAELRNDATAAVSRAREALTRSDLRLETEIIDLTRHGGDLVHALLHSAETWRAELVLVGARHHHGWLSRWVEGTVSEPLARSSHCPIMIVPARGRDLHRPPRRILFAIDGSSQSMGALAFGLTLAVPDADLRGIYVVDRAVRFVDVVPITALEDAFIEEGEKALSSARPLLEGVSSCSSVAMVSTERTNDDVAHAILREAGRWGADLIVVGSHGRRGMARWLLGSVAGRVARMTSIPLLIVNERDA
ncbi:universal stress protein [Burkholderia gladioli]|uniref:universal stress protein n=1 Tax=Burkholderia gladioli TaxID=28095 RepID=UPI00163DED32|nr:universal stress protein [Burkholderia gladioli]